MKYSNKQIFFIAILVIFGGIVIITTNSLTRAEIKYAETKAAAPAPARAVGSETPSANNTETPIVTNYVQALPKFTGKVLTANDIAINVRYEADYTQDSDNWRYTRHYSPPGSNEKYLAVPKDSQSSSNFYSYGSNGYHVFLDQGSHTYEGIPIFIKDMTSYYTIKYVGLKVTNAELIKDLTIEAGIDFKGGDDEDDTSSRRKETSTIVYTSLFAPAEAQACGPSHIIDMIGTSALKPAAKEKGVTWFSLEKPIRLYDLDLGNCDTNDNNDNEDGEDAEEEDYHYCFEIKDLSSGHLRANITYLPNKKQGLVTIQLVNIIFSDLKGKLYQPTMSGDFTHSYKAYIR